MATSLSSLGRSSAYSPHVAQWQQNRAQLDGGADDWFAAQGGPAAMTTAGGADTSWWDPADPRGSIARLFEGRAPTSQTILALAPQLQAAGIEISPPNAEGVTSKIHIPGVGWTRILEGGVAGGQGTGWNYVPQGSTGPGGRIPLGPSGAAGGIGAGLIESPGYQFRLGEGLKALEKSAAAKGTLLTGGHLARLQGFAQDYASNEYGQRVNQLSDLSRLGLAGTSGAAQTGSSYADLIARLAGGQAGVGSDLITGAGNAQAQGTAAAGQAWGQGLTGGANQAIQLYLLSQLFGRGGAAPGMRPASGPYG